MYVFIFSCVPELQNQLSKACQQSWFDSIMQSSRVRVFVRNLSNTGTSPVSSRKHCAFTCFSVSSPPITFSYSAEKCMDSKVFFLAVLCCPLVFSFVIFGWWKRNVKAITKKEKKVACGSGFRAFSCYAVGAVSFILCPDLGWPSGAGNRSLLWLPRTACIVWLILRHCYCTYNSLEPIVKSQNYDFCLSVLRLKEPSETHWIQFHRI